MKANKKERSAYDIHRYRRINFHECPFCNYTMRNRFTLRKHLEKVHGIITPRY